MIFGQLNRAVSLRLSGTTTSYSIGPGSIDGARAAQSLTPLAPALVTRSARPGDRPRPINMHEQCQCMQLNVWLLIEIQFENTLGLINEKSNSLKSHGVGVDVFI